MIVNIKYLLLSFIIASTLCAQKKLTYNNKGELSKQDYQTLLKTKKYQALSAFDTVSLKPLLIYAVYIKDKKSGILDDSAKEITPAIYDNIDGLNTSYTTSMFGFHENYRVKIGEKYGLISNTGKSILPVKYDYINSEEKKSIKERVRKEVIQDSIVIANLGNEELFFSPQGEQLKNKPQTSDNSVTREPDYAQKPISKPKKETTQFGDIIQNLDNGFAIVQAKVENKYYYQGLVELATNKLVLPIQYEYIIPQQNDRLIVIKSKKYNLYSKKGELLLKETYDGISDYGKTFRIQKGNKTAIFDKDLNQKTDFIFDSNSFGSSDQYMAEVKIDNKAGVIDSDGKVIIPFIYDKTEAYFNKNSSGFAFFKVVLNGKKGILSAKGERLTEIVYDEIVPEYGIEEPSLYGDVSIPTDHDYDAKENKYFIITKNKKFGLLDNNFKPLIDTKYDEIKKSFHPNFIIVGKKKTKIELSLLNIQTKTEILPYEYAYFKYLGGSYFMMYKYSTMGVCNLEGKIIIPMQPYKDLSDQYYFSNIYSGLQSITGMKTNYLIDYQQSLVNLLPIK